MTAAFTNQTPGRMFPARCVLVATVWLVSWHPARADEFEFFEKRIRPVLAERCYQCHSAGSEKLKGGLRLDTREGMLQGGESGRPAIVPGDAEHSLLIQAIRQTSNDLLMPPTKAGEKLTDAQIAGFVAWVNSGAPDPRVEKPESRNAKRDARTHWAFLPVARPTVPKARNQRWVQTPIDQFILAKLEERGLQPAPAADKRTLIRRAAYDLTGLPPTVEEVEAFLADKSPAAFEKVVDQLLASPHYGERWGRHWLDVARYSDTKGYVYDREEKRFVHAHTYRDWVTQALNHDLPYDQFLLQQIAADQLNPPGDPNLAAMGFLTVGRRFLGVTHDIIDDRIDVLARGTMGLSVGCARCHDHKFDPIPTRDYYALYGVFNSCSEQTVPLTRATPATRESEAFEKGLRERRDKLEQVFQKKRGQLTARLRANSADYLLAVLDVAKLPSEEFYAIMGPDDLNPFIVRQWEAFLFKTKATFHPVFAPWHAYAALPENEFAARAPAVYEKLASVENPRARVNPLVLRAFANSAPTSMVEVAQRYGKLCGDVNAAWIEAARRAGTNGPPAPTALDPNMEPLRQVLYGADSPASVPNGAAVDLEWFFDEGGRVEIAKAQAAIDKWIVEASGASPHAVVLADRATPKNSRVFIRGNPARKGEEVPRQFLEVASRGERKPFEHGSGRLELARAIASRDNPLTARVLVNRVWLHHFGAGLVGTPSDFGTRSEPPSHPELLDWLAARFMDDHWSLKQLHRLILLSATWQQMTEVASVATADPANRLLWHRNRQRLDFESMRDSLLAVTGELDRTLGGKPFELFAGDSPPRRTIYGLIDRQFVPGTLRMFDFANPDLHIPQRSETTVPQQALFFMNSPFVVERARALAGRADVREAGPVEEKIRRLYRAAYQRAPTPAQIAAGRNFIRATDAEPPPPPPKPVSADWNYGWGEFDHETKRTKNFQPLPHFTGKAWQGGVNWPDLKLGWVQVTAEGGHAGNDLQHAAIRRWIAPRGGTVRITGEVRHEPTEGDGIVARIVSSRSGLLGSWSLHTKSAEAVVESLEVAKGDTLDFMVDYRADLNSDMFIWSPVIRDVAGAAGNGNAVEWDSKMEFGGPPVTTIRLLDPWEKYAQVLLLSNEFLFVD